MAEMEARLGAVDAAEGKVAGLEEKLTKLTHELEVERQAGAGLREEVEQLRDRVARLQVGGGETCVSRTWVESGWRDLSRRRA